MITDQCQGPGACCNPSWCKTTSKCLRQQTGQQHAQAVPVVVAPLEGGVRPVAWTLRAELDARQTTCKAHLWFTNPKNSAWAPLYDQATLDAAVAVERAESARLRHLLNLARDDYNTAAQRLQEIGDYAHDQSTGPAVPDALWEVRSMAYGSGA